MADAIQRGSEQHKRHPTSPWSSSRGTSFSLAARRPTTTQTLSQSQASVSSSAAGSASASIGFGHTGALAGAGVGLVGGFVTPVRGASGGAVAGAVLGNGGGPGSPVAASVGSGAGAGAGAGSGAGSPLGGLGMTPSSVPPLVSACLLLLFVHSFTRFRLLCAAVDLE